MSDTQNRLRFGKISSPGTGTFQVFSGGYDSTNFIRIKLDVSNASQTASFNSNVAGYRGFDHILDGQILRIGAGDAYFTDNITTILHVDTLNQELHLADTPFTSNSDVLAAVRPAKGQAFIQSGSLTTPQYQNPSWDWDDITGSLDDDFQEGDLKWGVVLQLASTASSTTSIGGRFGQYDIFNVFERHSDNIASFYITSSDIPVFQEPTGETPSTAQSQFGIVELSITSSLATIFDGADINLGNDYGLAPYLTAVKSYYDTLNQDTFPYTGSAQITGSLGVTGSIEFNTQTGGTDFFIIKSGSTENLKFNGEGIAQLFAYANSYEPTPVLGGIYFTSSSLWIGTE